MLLTIACSLEPIWKARSQLDKVRWFISGPMTGYVGYNRDAFFKAEEFLKQEDCFVYNPARLNWDNGAPADYMMVALPMLLTCTDLYILKGSEDSCGATIERLLAIYCGLVITWEQ